MLCYCIACGIVLIFSNAPSCSESTCFWTLWAPCPTDENPFSKCPGRPMMLQIYEDVVLRAVLTLTWWRHTLRIPRNGLQDMTTDPHNISHYPRGKQNGGAKTIILIRAVSLTCFVQGLGSSSQSMGPSVIFSSLFLTSYDKQHHLLSIPLLSLTLQAFIFAQPLNQALRQLQALHWNRQPRGSVSPHRIHSNSNSSVLQNNQVPIWTEYITLC